MNITGVLGRGATQPHEGHRISPPWCSLVNLVDNKSAAAFPDTSAKYPRCKKGSPVEFLRATPPTALEAGTAKSALFVSNKYQIKTY
jgi:hypothetical protein